MEKRIDFRDQIKRNKRKSFFLMFSIFLIFLILGYVISKAFAPDYFFTIMIIAIVLSLIYIFASYYNSHKIAIKSVGAKKALREKYPEYHNLIEGLILASGLPKPDLYIMESNQINAFASGRDPKHAVVCVTQGALEKLDRRELEAVLAHELGHIKNYDMRYMTIATIMVGMIAIVSEIFLRSLWFQSIGGGDDNKGNAIFIIIGILLAILAPIIAYLVQSSISRKREYSADASSAKFTRYPEALIRALEKIKKDSPNTKTNKKKISKAMAPLFFSNPFGSVGRTHPPIDKRIQVLKRM